MEDTLVELITYLTAVHKRYGDGKLSALFENEYVQIPLKAHRDPSGTIVLVDPEESPRAIDWQRLHIWITQPTEEKQMEDEKPVDILKNRLSFLIRFIDDEEIKREFTYLFNDAIAFTPEPEKARIRFPKTIHKAEQTVITDNDAAAYERRNDLIEEHTTLTTGWLGKDNSRRIIWYNRQSNQMLSSELTNGVWVNRDELFSLEDLRGLRKVKVFKDVGQRQAQAEMEMLSESLLSDESLWHEVLSKEDGSVIYHTRKPLL